MIALIKKDIVFNFKWFLALVLISPIMPVVFAFDTDTRLTPIVFIFGPILANAWLLPKSCYSDDNSPTRTFLSTLPLTKYSLIGSKYVLGLICIVLSLLITTTVLIIFGVQFSAQSVIISSVWLLIYYGAFLLTFYRANYSIAEKTNQSLLLLTIFLMFFLDRTGIVLDSMIVAPGILIVALAACTLLYGLSFLLSVRSYKI